MKWDPPELEQLFERFRTQASPWIVQRTVVIYGVSDLGNSVPDATGTLLQVADRCFVLTAAHVLKDWGRGRRYALAVDDRIANDDGVLELDLTTVRAEISSEDKGDMALLPLTNEMNRPGMSGGSLS